MQVILQNLIFKILKKLVINVIFEYAFYTTNVCVLIMSCITVIV